MNRDRVVLDQMRQYYIENGLMIRFDVEQEFPWRKQKEIRREIQRRLQALDRDMHRVFRRPYPPDEEKCVQPM